jgi:hypothetical protein
MDIYGNNRQQVVADSQKKNTDVFDKDPATYTDNPTSTILLDLGGGVRIDTQGLIALIALSLWLYSRRS